MSCVGCVCVARFIVRARRDSCAVLGVVLCCRHWQQTTTADSFARETRSDNLYMYVASSFSAEICPAQLLARSRWSSAQDGLFGISGSLLTLLSLPTGFCGRHLPSGKLWTRSPLAQRLRQRSSLARLRRHRSSKSLWCRVQFSTL